jgi:hypothetical protein
MNRYPTLSHILTEAELPLVLHGSAGKAKPENLKQNIVSNRIDDLR